MDADGSNRTNLTNSPAVDQHPTWSPDGTQIAFETDRDGNMEIYVMNADGSNPTNWSNCPSAVDTCAAWSTAGIAFRSDRDGNNEIYVNGTNVSNNSANDGMPAWHPDATKIAFRSTREGNSDIYTMNADGTNQTRHTTDPAYDTWPSW